MDDCWCVFPWDAHDIYDHTRAAEGGCGGGGAAADAPPCAGAKAAPVTARAALAAVGAAP
jgi:hypothetical protein